MNLPDFRPRPQLVTKQTTITRPRFPVIDAHNHLGEFGGGWDKKPLAQLLDVLDRAEVRHFIDLDGGWGEEILDNHLELFAQRAPDRIRVFGGVDWSQWARHGDEFGFWAAERFQAQVARGATGLKIWKPFGLHVRDQHNRLVAVDDTRLDPLWAMAGQLNVPVLVHVADPVAFFDPIDASNERWEELHAHPDWQFLSPPFPAFLEILEAFKRTTQRHPGTDFVIAHVGCYAENLGWVAQWLDDCPNVYIDFSARIAEVGRQPYSARKFFIHYADRILFGTDMPADLATYQMYYRFLESDDEYFPYHLGDVPPQGRWNIYGLYLPDDVLRKIYYQNAEQVMLRLPKGV
jgi:predicted TIM-barrel fold metal-dependent hydrolase